MIRTRNFVLYVAVVVFLVAGIGVTVISDNSRRALENFLPVNFTGGEIPVGAFLVTDSDDREENLNRLKSKIAAGEGTLISAPPVFTSVDSQPSSTESLVSGSRSTPLTCASYSSQTEVRAEWPQGGVKMKEVEGARLVYVESADENEATIEESVLLQLPVKQVRAENDSCIDGPYIGVTLGGALIDNNQTANFFNVGGNVQIGYALDGFPIYGRKTSDAFLDACGGTTTNEGYRYYLGENSNFVLTCFAGMPAEL